ncbi:hypothetical protein EWM64_g6282 [Hericium alpestre]|uniref:Uncharacterized protein n=1 Tax=Hericium alpestre TaxID=135208 RepID=A0A4Y9ZU80_9AGAM|nr:hypothetical protein EWM64_g6282 [Hericium alpestre]
MMRDDVWQLSLGPQGFGNWSGLVASAGGRLAIYNPGAGDSIELGASNSGRDEAHLANPHPYKIGLLRVPAPALRTLLPAHGIRSAAARAPVPAHCPHGCNAPRRVHTALPELPHEPHNVAANTRLWARAVFTAADLRRLPARIPLLALLDADPALPAAQTHPVILRRRMPWPALLAYLRTFSSLHTFHERYPADRTRADGDIALRFYTALREGVRREGGDVRTAEAQGEEAEVEVEWPMAVVLVKRA